MRAFFTGAYSGRSIGSRMAGAAASSSMLTGMSPGLAELQRAASMLRRMSITRRFSNHTWSSRNRRSCSESWRTVAWVRSAASSQS